MEELKMSKYLPDTTASAVILFDKGEYNLTDQLTVEIKRHMRIKFLTKAAIDNWASRTVNYREIRRVFQN